MEVSMPDADNTLCRSSSVDKLPTGIPGLDEVLNGGIPLGSLTLLSGGPGTGKTMIGLELLARAAGAGTPCALLTFEERESALRRYAAGIGLDLASLEKENLFRIIGARIDPQAILAGDFDLKGITAILSSTLDRLGGKLVLIDAPDAFLGLLSDRASERAELRILHEWLVDRELTSIMTVKRSAHNGGDSYYDFLDYMADCVVHLDQRVQEQITTRRLRVIKYRGSSYGRNEYPFGITRHGVWIIPVTQTSLQQKALGESLPTGVAGMDELMGGGYRRGSCTLFTGGSGTGKTTFVCSFVERITSQGEKVLYIDFEESWDALLSCMSSPGLKLEPAMDAELMKFLSIMPEAQGVEEHLIQAFMAIKEFEPHHLVVDAISACRRMGSKHAAFDYMLRLINHCKQRGITSLLTNLASTRDYGSEISGMDLSSVIDTAIILRNEESGGEYIREMGILKSRGRNHSSAIHPFLITDSGIKVQGGALQ